MIDKKIVKLWVKWFFEKRVGVFHRFLKLSEPMKLEIVKEIGRIVNAPERKVKS